MRSFFGFSIRTHKRTSAHKRKAQPLVAQIVEVVEPRQLNSVTNAVAGGFAVDTTLGANDVARMNPTTFYPRYYLERNQDLVNAFGPNNLDAATNHWNQHGIQEGRRPNPYFAAREYLELHPTLRTALGNDFVRATQHWLSDGAPAQARGAHFIDTPPPSLSRDPSGQFVVMQTGTTLVKFDSLQGGTPLSWISSGQSLVSSHPGAGMSIVWNSGQDPTQASANGPDQFPIARLNDPGTSHFAYYARETLFAPPTIGNANSTYEVTGFAPFFWISHEGRDDAIPTVPGQTDHGWRTQYHNPSGRYTPQDLSAAGVPIWFEGRPGNASGILLVGNEMVGTEVPWNQRLTPISEGRFAMQVRVHLNEAAPDAFASIMFRRQMPTSGAADIHSAYRAPGYSLNLNKQGVIEIQRSDGSGAAPQSVWSSRVSAAQASSAAGVQLELRTQNWDQRLVEVWANGVKLGTYSDPSPILGEHFGLFAQSSSGRVKFSERHVYDVGVEFVSRYTARPNGVIEADLQMRNAPGVSSTHQLYRASTTAYLDQNSFPNDQRRTWFYDSNGQMFQREGITVGALQGPGTASAIWAGNQEGTKGLFLKPTRFEINGLPSAQPHALAQSAAVNNEFIIAVNPLPVAANSQPVAVNSWRTVIEWSPRIPLGYAGSRGFQTSGSVNATPTTPTQPTAPTTPAQPTQPATPTLASTNPQTVINQVGYDYAPTVLFENGKYRMWWCHDADERPGSRQRDAIFYSEATSPNGPWSKPVSVFAPRGNSRYFDGGHICDPSIVVVNGTYYMYYSGNARSDARAATKIGVATSSDGIHWTRANNGQPIISPRRSSSGQYGAGQPSATVVDGKVYLVFTDTTAPASNRVTGGGVYVIRSTDPTFRGPVEELTAAEVFTLRTSTAQLKLNYKIFDAVSVDWQFLDRTGIESDRFLMSVNGVVGKNAVLSFDRNFNRVGETVFLDNVPWTEGPGVARQANGYSLTANSDQSLPWKVFYSNGAPGRGNEATWDLAFSDFNLTLS